MPNGNINGDLASHGHITGVLTIGAGGTSDYEMLENKPQINGHELIDNQTAHELGLASMQDVADIDSDIALLSQKLPKNYSTDEQNTGVKWLDGKYIYQKSYNVNINNTTVTTPTDIDSANIISMNGIIHKSTGGVVLTAGLMYYDAGDWLNIQYYNGIRIMCTSWFIGASGVVTIFYTKNE